MSGSESIGSLLSGGPACALTQATSSSLASKLLTEVVGVLEPTSESFYRS